MSEIAKTVTFVIAGGVFLGVAWVARPAALETAGYNDAGERFFELFDALEAKRLQIVEFDEQTGRPSVFQVAQTDGLWSIPSAENYPADAEDQLAKVAAGVLDLVKSPSVGDSPAAHERYGVLDPTGAELGATGVGTRITLRNATDKVLVDLIVGREVGGADGQHYVRQPGRDRVYTAAVPLETFSTKFEDWIERDLLQLNPSDIRRVGINDYSIDELNNRLIQRDVLTLSWDPKAATWSLEGLSESEELVPQDINTMKWALDDLEIVDVHRKPPGLSAELRADDQMQLDPAAVGSLRSRGYYIYEGRLISNEGEMTVGTADGVHYTLRFGEIALGTGSGADDASGANRYLFVTAGFDESLMPAPEMAVLPDLDLAGLLQNDDEFIDEDEDGEDDAQARIREALEEARARVQQENQEKAAEHESKLEAGREKAARLTDRFADWYYVISDRVYQKLRLSRDDLVKSTEEAEDEGDTAG